MLSVLKNTKTPVKFWFLKNYLSPTFKVGFLRFCLSAAGFSVTPALCPQNTHVCQFIVSKS